MSVYLYDEALVSKFREITGDERIHIVPPDNAIEFLASIDNDKVKYPAVVLSRNSVTLQDYRNQAVSLKGQSAKINDENLVVKAKLIPLRVEWSVDVFTVDRFSCDEIIRELVFYLISYPRLEVKVPYGLDIPQNFDIIVSPEIVDNSDLIEHSNRGVSFRETLTIYTENAHFYSSGRKYPVYTGLDFEIKNNDKGDE